MHSFYRIQFDTNGKFKASRLKADYLADLIKDKKLRIRHEERPDGSFVITAPTSELQQFMEKYGTDARFFPPDNSINLKKKG